MIATDKYYYSSIREERIMAAPISPYSDLQQVFELVEKLNCLFVIAFLLESSPLLMKDFGRSFHSLGEETDKVMVSMWLMIAFRVLVSPFVTSTRFTVGYFNGI
ncbi:hypothetical protein ACLOJK_010572 [Asimina triloba]